MNRMKASLYVLVTLLAGAGCGDTSSGSAAEHAATGGTGPGSGGADPGTGGTAGGVGGQWLYATDDEGVFPKDRVLQIEVTMPPEAWTQLIATAEEEVWSSANVTIDGQPLGDVGFRPKGAYSLDSCVDDSGQLVCDKLSFKLKFNEIDPDGRFYGLKRLVLNQVVDGWSLTPESLAYQIFNDFGVVAPRTSFAVLTVNGSSLGIYRVVEVVDGRFTAQHFTDGDGNLYKEAWPDNSDDASYAAKLETNEETASNAALLAFSADMAAATDAELPATLARYMDLDHLLDYMAVDYGIANWDGITTFYASTWGQANHNFYLYQAVDAPTFTLIPWDLNATFFLDHWLGDIPPWDDVDADCAARIPTEDDPDLFTIPASCDPTIRALALSKERYHAAVQRLLDEVFVVERLSAQVDAYVAQVEPVMGSDPFVTYAEVVEGAGWVKASLPTFRTRLEDVLAAPTTP